MAQTTIFLSTVTSEFRSYRDALSHDLERPNLTVKVQEDFIATGEETLDKLDDYIRQCDAVIHLVGNMTGSFAKSPSVEMIRRRYPDFLKRFPILAPFLEPGGKLLSYTQWEAWLALYHRRVLIIAVPTDDAPRYEDYEFVDEQYAAQQAHLALLKQYERYPDIYFANSDRLGVEIYRSRVHDILPRLQFASATMDRLRDVASSLLEVGRATWNTPRFIAPLSLEEIEETKGADPKLTTIHDLTKAISLGENLVLYGDGGIGKTTFLLQLSETLLVEKCQRIPFYIDAAYWARSNFDVFSYIANTTAAKRYGVKSSELLNLADSGCMTLVVNGWNEMPGDQRNLSHERMRELSTTIPSLNIIVVTRSMTDAPKLEESKHVHVRGLTWEAQVDVIRSELGGGSAEELIGLLVRNARLRHAAKSPLMLRGLMSQANKADVAALSIYDHLGAVVNEYEKDPQRQYAIQAAPLRDQHGSFLEELAVYLTSKQETTCSLRDVLPVISSVSKKLVEQGMFGSMPEPNDVLNALSNHHLLQVDEHTIRFAHQRFQEYFASTRLLSNCVRGGEQEKAFIRETINLPFWGDAFRLVAGKMKGAGKYSLARCLLIRTAMEVDLGFACDLVGVCAFSEKDDADLLRDLIDRVNVLADSPHSVVAELGLAYAISSGLAVFSERLWTLIESEDQQVRLGAYSLHGDGISLKQLGDGAELRISTWLPERKAELMHELSDNPDNYDYLVKAANDAAEVNVRAAAISALAWRFPASDVALEAWVTAPVDVQVERNILEMLEHDLQEGVVSRGVHERIKEVVRDSESKELKLKLAPFFPDDVGKEVVGAILSYLEESDGRSEYVRQLVKMAVDYAPGGLKGLVRKLILTKRNVPSWVVNVVMNESGEFRSEVFEDALDVLDGGTLRNIDFEVVGMLAAREQIVRCVREYLECVLAPRGEPSSPKKDRVHELLDLLANVSGDELLSVVVEIGKAAKYEERAVLLELVSRRMSDSRLRRMKGAFWLPTIDDIKLLIEQFGSDRDESLVPQNSVHVHLCDIAGHVSPADFSDLIIDGFKLHLDAWGKYDAVLSEWGAHRTAPRPMNPYLGNHLISAAEAWGFDAVYPLMELLAHPQYGNLIPETICRIVKVPWSKAIAGNKDALFVKYMSAGEERRLSGRTLLQPDNTYQDITDAVAVALGEKLGDLVERCVGVRDGAVEAGKGRRAEYAVGELLRKLSSIPSHEVVTPVTTALVNVKIDLYQTVDAVSGLVHQGMFIEDVNLVERLECLYEEKAKAEWFDQSKKSVMSRLCQLMFFVRPIEILKKTLSFYLQEWQRYDNIYNVIRDLGESHLANAWEMLIEISEGEQLKEEIQQTLAFSLASSLSDEHYYDFLGIVSDGRLFNWCRNSFLLDRNIAPHVFKVIDSDSSRLDEFLRACNASGSPFADELAFSVLNLIPDNDEVMARYSLSVLDGGRVGDSSTPLYSKLESMFTVHIPIGEHGAYEMRPKACNEFRRQLYLRASGNGDAAIVSKILLADIENSRRERGRPMDEPRHPVPDCGIAWTDALVVDAV